MDRRRPVSLLFALIRHSRPEYFRALERAGLENGPLRLAGEKQGASLPRSRAKKNGPAEVDRAQTSGSQVRFVCYAVMSDSKATRFGMTIVDPVC
jgi:hypothetical protein